MSNKKYFSNNNENSYNDFLKIKKGREMIKNAISNNNYNLDTFINYETFLIITKAFYDKLNNKYKISPPTSINDSNTSFLNYKSVLSHLHNDNCDHCSKCPIEEIVDCKNVENILYPYGKSIVKNDPLENIYYPHNINLNLYCKICPTCIDKCETIHYKKCPQEPCNSGCCTCNSCKDNQFHSEKTTCCNNGCGKAGPLFFQEKRVCKCFKSNCVKCHDYK